MTGFRGGADDIVHRFSTLLVDAGLDQDKISNIATTVRQEYAGSFVYVKKTDPQRDLKVLSAFRRLGDVKKVSKELAVSKSTVYMIISRGSKK